MTTKESTPDPQGDIRDLALSDWRPVSQATVTTTPVDTPAFEVIDIHNHLGRWLSDGDWRRGTADWMVDPREMIGIMDAHRVQTVVNLDGMWGDELDANIRRYDLAYPGRFATFCQLDWSLLSQPDGARRLRDSLEDSRRRGARGVKVWKTLGLEDRRGDGSLARPDDDEVSSVLAHAGELGMPVLIHVADPKAFFQPLDARNERLDELAEMPQWWFGDAARYPAFDTLLTALRTLVLATPGTTYIGAHAGCCAEDLDWVDALLDAAPNFHIDIAGRMAELGRQPRRFRRLVEKHPSRVLFGTDIFPASAEQYRLHFRFLETDDEGFEYAPDSDIPPQGRWAVSAIDLPRRLLEGVYAGNARRILETS